MAVKIVLCTTADIHQSKRLAKEIVLEKLAACVNIIEKVNSIYYWDSKIQDDSESLMIIKSEEKAIPGLKQFIKERHSYTNPEIIVIDVTDGSNDYLKWVSQYVEYR